ncbi:hypothetical protein TorRG33x02_072170, partial [Trema orientale]
SADKKIRTIKEVKCRCIIQGNNNISYRKSGVRIVQNKRAKKNYTYQNCIGSRWRYRHGIHYVFHFETQFRTMRAQSHTQAHCECPHKKCSSHSAQPSPM